MKKEILAIIPARGGSKSIKRKNIKPILGKPMVFYSIDACKNSEYITRFVVSTEDEEIKSLCLKYGAEVIDRPLELAQDETKTAPVMLHCAQELEKSGYKPDYVALIQPTSPFRDSVFIDRAFDYFFAQNNCDSCFSVFSQGVTHARWRELKDGSLEALYDYRNRPRRQDLQSHLNLYCENGAFYTVEYNIFKKVQDFIGKKPCLYKTTLNIDVDEPKDFEKAEEILKGKG